MQRGSQRGEENWCMMMEAPAATHCSGGASQAAVHLLWICQPPEMLVVSKTQLLPKVWKHALPYNPHRSFLTR